MELNKKHREALLKELSTAIEDRKLQMLCLQENEKDNLKSWFEVSIFLADQRIKLIEQSLIDNEIDF